MGISYEYLSFVGELRAMGHIVHHFDHLRPPAAEREEMNDFFRSIVKRGAYDLVLIVTATDEFTAETLDYVRKYAPTVAWNCDDDARWDSYSSKWVEHYTWMVTTYRHIYEANREQHRNLLLSQWACTGLCDGADVHKDVDISFVGGAYGARIEHIARLRKELGLLAFGRGVADPDAWRVLGGASWKGAVKQAAARLLRIPFDGRSSELETQEDVKAIWNRSRICFTPLEGSRGGLQIKARVFDQGLSGALMLCSRNEAIHELYEPGKEYVEYSGIDDAIEKARYYLAHERERRVLADAYRERTRTDHLWSHRFERLFSQLGLHTTTCGANSAGTGD